MSVNSMLELFVDIYQDAESVTYESTGEREII